MENASWQPWQFGKYGELRGIKEDERKQEGAW